MDREAVVKRISQLNGHGQFYVWASEHESPTGIEPKELNDHIKGKVMDTLQFLDQSDAPEDLDSAGSRYFIIKEIEYFETHGHIRPSR